MKVLLTGHNGYVGSVMSRMLIAAKHDVTGLDTFLFEECSFGLPARDLPALRLDVRDVTAEHLFGFDAVIHLAALCNDPLGNMNPEHTYEINHRATVRPAPAAKAAGVPRFLFASSCSLYGLATDGFLQEDAPFNPVTPYGRSKILAEQDLATLADDDFSPTYLRNATAFGVSPRLRNDIVLNNLVGHACTSGRIRIMSDGSPWRPLVHVEDFSRAFIAVLEAPRERVHDEAFNVGQTSENYRVRELAEMVLSVVPESSVEFAEGGGPDPRNYRVDCSKIAETLPAFRPQRTARSGVEELYAAFLAHRLTADEFAGHRYLRIKNIQRLQAEGRLGDDLRWLGTQAPAARAATAAATAAAAAV
jgi:nucleoside-diphosphate-sugar epimerase